MIALIWINSLVDFESYRAKVPATLEPYEGEIRFRAETIVTLVDENELEYFSQIALLRAPNQGDMDDLYVSEAYRNLKKLRASASSFAIVGLTSN